MCGVWVQVGEKTLAPAHSFGRLRGAEDDYLETPSESVERDLLASNFALFARLPIYEQQPHLEWVGHLALALGISKHLGRQI